MLITHQKQWEFLQNKFKLGELSHAYLFSGSRGIGKKEFAEKFIEFVGCKFPDIKIIKRGEDKNGIEVSQIREVQNFLSYKAYNGKYKAVIVQDADLMNQEAQNCFLKTLEEPKGDALIILISSMPDRMIETVLSRCQRVKFFAPSAPAGGKENRELLDELIPVMAADFAGRFSYVKAVDFEKQDAQNIFEAMQSYVREALLEKIGAGNAGNISAHMKKYSVGDLKRILQTIEKMQNKLAFTNANQKLALEIVLMEF